MTGSGTVPPRFFSDDGQRLYPFSLHLDFLAVDERAAVCHGSEYADALNILRTEVECYTARVSAGGNWSRSVPVFCCAPGPRANDMCTDPAGHEGWHFGPGGSRHWTDQEIPQAPDTIQGLTSEPHDGEDGGNPTPAQG